MHGGGLCIGRGITHAVDADQKPLNNIAGQCSFRARGAAGKFVGVHVRVHL